MIDTAGLYHLFPTECMSDMKGVAWDIHTMSHHWTSPDGACAVLLLCCFAAAVLCSAVRCCARSRISCHPSIESPIPKIVHCH